MSYNVHIDLTTNRSRYNSLYTQLEEYAFFGTTAQPFNTLDKHKERLTTDYNVQESFIVSNNSLLIVLYKTPVKGLNLDYK
jgi:hypothetical protein